MDKSPEAAKLKKKAREEACLQILAAQAAAAAANLAPQLLFGKLTHVLLAALASMSHATICSALRTIGELPACSLAFSLQQHLFCNGNRQPAPKILARHALVFFCLNLRLLHDAFAGTLAEARAAYTGASRYRRAPDPPLATACMAALQGRVLSVLNSPGFSAHERLLALEALLWLTAGAGDGSVVTPPAILQWLSAGGASVPAEARATFADPWPDHILGSLLQALHRRYAA